MWSIVLEVIENVKTKTFLDSTQIKNTPLIIVEYTDRQEARHDPNIWIDQEPLGKYFWKHLATF